MSTCLAATAPPVLAKLFRIQDALRAANDVAIHTQHVIHAGIYARTITMPPDTVLMGAFVKIPTLLITVGSAKVFTGEGWKYMDGYRVIPASAQRKQIFVSRGPLIITALFATSAKTVEEAEREFTDEFELLLSHEQTNEAEITGE